MYENKREGRREGKEILFRKNKIIQLEFPWRKKWREFLFSPFFFFIFSFSVRILIFSLCLSLSSFTDWRTRLHAQSRDISPIFPAGLGYPIVSFNKSLFLSRLRGGVMRALNCQYIISRQPSFLTLLAEKGV